MSKKKTFFAFAAGVALGALISKTHIVVAPGEKQAPADVPAPTLSQAVPRPGRPRPQMRAAGQTVRPKRVR